MRSMTIRKSLAVGAVASLAMFTAACGSDEGDTDTDTGGDDTSSEEPTEEMTEDMTEEPSEEEPTEDMTEEPGMDPAANLVGPGCAAYAEANPEGPASVEGMAQEPVGSAAAGNPLLGTLVSAVTGELNPDVDLLGALNTADATYTVFAPVDEAFEKLDQATLEAIQTPEGAETLETVLTYHVLTERVEPADLSGSYPTLAGPELMVEGQGDNITVNGESAVICGGVQTSNATVYLIDTVLMPPAGGGGR